MRGSILRTRRMKVWADSNSVLLRWSVLRWTAAAAAAGFHLCIADWRTTNVEAARFWPRLGFQPAAYRLVRKIDPRIAWATY